MPRLPGTGLANATESVVETEAVMVGAVDDEAEAAVDAVEDSGAAVAAMFSGGAFGGSGREGPEGREARDFAVFAVCPVVATVAGVELELAGGASDLGREEEREPRRSGLEKIRCRNPRDSRTVRAELVA
jgi:hypothetical protein